MVRFEKTDNILKDMCGIIESSQNNAYKAVNTDEDIARYSVLHGNEQLFASKYKLYLPTEEELRAEIEMQKAMFYLRQKENKDD